MSIARTMLASAVACFCSFSLAADRLETGEVPKSADGRPLNLDFERGTLANWTPQGKAFEDQPIKGDSVTARGRGMKSEHAGQFWIGGFEQSLSDELTGTLTSEPFVVTRPWATFLVAGGSSHDTRVELVNGKTGEVIAERSGDNTETLKPAVVDLQKLVGQEIFIRLVDNSRGGWGHVNFDDFRLHASRPDLPGQVAEQPDDYPFAGLDPEAAAKAMVVPDGFRVTLQAGEPDVKQPIAMAFDDRGRLWVAEAYTYPIRAAEGKGQDRILIFEDTDGDDRFDRRTVFIENLNLVSGIEVGFGGVWVGAAPYLLFVPDRDGDDRPDGPPEVLLDGWGYEDTHETLNSFTWGPDGWLYGCHGVFTHSNVGKPGSKSNERTPLNAGIWRYHPTRHAFELFAQGTSNPWGVDFDDFGQAFATACVIPHLYHIIQGGRYQRQAGEHFNRNTYDDIKTIAVHRHWLGGTPHAGNNRSDAAGGGHAHAGAMVYLGAAWPEKYRNQIFMNNIHGQRLNQDQLAPRGSGYVGDRAPDFCLARDRWSQIINLQYGPDGQMSMIDWYDANACHHRETNGHDRTNGRIFKVSYGDARSKPVDLRKLSDDQLVDLQLSPNDWHVRHARRLLQERASTTVRARLAEMAFTHSEVTRRLRALWALGVTGGVDEAIALRGLANDQPPVRAWTTQLLTDDPKRELSDAILAKLADLAEKDSSPVVRLYLCSALQRMPLEKRWGILKGLLSHAEDASDHNLPLMLWYAAEPLASVDAARALDLAAGGKIPTVHSFMIRRITRIGEPAALNLVASRLSQVKSPADRLLVLDAMIEGLKGRRQVAMPAAWKSLSARLLDSESADVRARTSALGVTFGDPAALARLRATLVNDRESEQARREALDALLAARDPELAPAVQKLVSQGVLRGAAIRALAAYDNAETPGIVLGVFNQLTPEEKRDALNTLAARPSSGQALVSAIAAKQIAASELSADVVRQLRNLKNETVNKAIAELWGIARDSSAEKASAIEQYKSLARVKSPGADPSLGRSVFVKTCQQCHTLFGVGAKTGPELTGSNRANLDYLLSNILDPSAVMAKEYQPSVLALGDGRVVTGIVRDPSSDPLSVQTANELLVIPRGEVEEIQVSQQSMMPEDLLKPLSVFEVRSLLAYLAAPAQVPLAATNENVKSFFNGHDLAGWTGDESLWSVESGEIVGRTTGLKENEFLRSEMLFGDFRLRVDVNLVGNQGNSGIQFRSEALPNGHVKGYQADIGPGWWGKLYEELGRGLLSNTSGESYLKPGWNTYEIQCSGSKIRTWINGQQCVDLEDTGGARRGIFALQLHSGGATEVRFRNFEIELK